jgi:lysyl-tRNA synthetase class 1
MSEVLPPELLRFVLIRPQPRQAVKFDAAGDTIPRYYDEYDKCARAYFEGGDADAARVFALSQVDEEGLEPRVLPRFSTVATWLQIPHVDPLTEARAAKGAELNVHDVEEVESRVRYARLWLERYAPEEAKMSVRAEVPPEAATLTPAQRELLRRVAARLRAGSVDADVLQSELYDWGKELGLSSRDTFAAVYLALLGKTGGAKAGWLLTRLDAEFVAARFETVAAMGDDVRTGADGAGTGVVTR